MTAVFLLLLPQLIFARQSGEYFPTGLGAHWEYVEYYSNKKPHKISPIGFVEVDVIFSGTIRRQHIIIKQYKTYAVRAGSPYPKKISTLINNAEEILVRSRHKVESVATYHFEPEQKKDIPEGSKEFKNILNELSCARSHFLTMYRKTGLWPWTTVEASSPTVASASLDVSSSTLVDSPKADSTFITMDYHVQNKKKEDEAHRIQVTPTGSVRVQYPVRPGKTGRKKSKSDFSEKQWDCISFVDNDSQESRCLAAGTGEVLTNKPADNENWELRSKELVDAIMPY